MKTKRFVGSRVVSHSVLPCVVMLASLANAQAATLNPSTSNSISAGHTGAVNLNLSSTKANLSAPNVAVNKSLTILVGGAKQSITSSTKLTPAEMAAVYQVVNTGHQSLIISSKGNAVGGTLSIGNSLANLLNNLVVPGHVEVSDNVKALSLSGDLSNSGKFVVTDSNQASITAKDIYNIGSISSSSNLALYAADKIVNAGMISTSKGDLTLSANAITNNATGVLQAANNLNLRSADITNAGKAEALAGNLNISTASPMDIVVNNSLGTLQALSGAINIGDPTFSGQNNLTINGGNALSNTLNFYSACGAVNANLDQVTGTVNVHAGEAHVVAASNNLSLGAMDITGDPSFYNTQGAVTIDGSLSFPGQALAIVAKTNIVSGITGSISTSSGTASGGAISLVAGANFTVSPSNTSSTTTSGQNSGNGDTTNTIKITGGTTAGGFIDLTGGSGVGDGSTPMTINSSSTSATAGQQNGGNVTLVAYGGTGLNAGAINLPAPVSASSILSGGSGAGVNGNVTMIAGSKTSGATAINIGGINALGGTGAGGIVTLSTALPTITGGTSVSILNGVLQLPGGNFAAGTIQPTSVTLNNDTSNSNGIIASQIKITAGNNISWSGSGNLAASDISAPSIYGPFTVAFNPSGTFAYVTDFGSNNFPYPMGTPVSTSISVINTATNAVTPLNVGNMPSGVAFNPAGTIAYVTNYNAPNAVAGVGTVSIINATNNTVLPTTITVGQGPAAVEFNKTGTAAYVVNYISNTVSVINTATNTVSKTINVGLNPDAIVLNQAGTVAYVANSNSGTISVINLQTNTVTSTITGLNSPYNLSITPNGKFVYAANAGQPGSGLGVDTLSVINTATNKIVATINDPNGTPSGIAVNSSGTFAYSTDYTLPGKTGTTFGVDGASSVNVINTATNKIVNTFNLLPHNDSFVNSVMFNPSGTLAYVANYNNSDPGPPTTPVSTISVINISPPVLQATSAFLSAGSNGGGSVTAFTQTSSLTAHAVGNVSVYNTGSVTLQANGTTHNAATGTYQLITTPDAVNNSGQITINDTVTASGTSGTISLQSSENIGTGGITQSAGTSLNAATVILADANNGIGPGTGTSAIGVIQPILTNAQNLMANTLGNVLIKDSSATTISGASSGATFSLTDTALAGGIKINSGITATTALDLTTSAASGTVISELPAASVVTPFLNISLAGVSTANLSTSLLNNVNELAGSGSSKSSIMLSTNSSLQLDTFGTSQNVSVTATGLLSPGVTPVSLGSLTATANSIVLGSQQIGLSTTSSVTLNATGVAGISQAVAGDITALSISLTTTATGSTIEQSSTTALNVTSPLVSINMGIGGQALISDSTAKPVQLSNSTANSGSLSFASVGSLSTRGTVSAMILILSSSSGSISGTTQANYLTANTVGSANNITLTNNGSVTLSDPANGNLTSTAGGNFTLNVVGTLTSYLIDTAGGSLSFTATNVLLQSATLQANNGNVLVNSNNQATGSIILQNGTTISANSANPLLGNVTISVGSAAPAKTNTVAPANVNPAITAGGKIFYGVNSITSLNFGSNNTLTATGRTITFSTGTASAAAIQLSGQDSITAASYQHPDQSDDEIVVETGDDVE